MIFYSLTFYVRRVRILGVWGLRVKGGGKKGGSNGTKKVGKGKGKDMLQLKDVFI